MKYFTIPQLAQELNRDFATVLELVNTFKLPAIQMNQRVRVRLSKRDIQQIGMYLAEKRYN